jgi:hypothetical protein
MLIKYLLPAKQVSYKKLIALMFSIGFCGPSLSQNKFEGLEYLFSTPKSYVVQHTNEALKIDGNLQESAWQKAQWTNNFVDIEGDLKPAPFFDTKVKMLWNDSTLFVAAQLQEPQVWATQTHHDDIIFKDNDFEIFISPANNAHQYFEIEVNALNKIFDLFLPKPYRNGGDALISWDVEHLKSAVQIQGTLNKPGDKDKGWTVEMAIPLKAIRMGFATEPPKEGAVWRINFSRVEWDTKVSNGKNVKLTNAAGKNLPERNWVWSPQGIINMHAPERWGYLQFTRKDNSEFKMPYTEYQRKYLWLVYYRQKQFMEKNGKYAATLNELGVEIKPNIEGQENQLKMQATDNQFTASIAGEDAKLISINDEGLIKIINSK